MKVGDGSRKRPLSAGTRNRRAGAALYQVARGRWQEHARPQGATQDQRDESALAKLRQLLLNLIEEQR
jgi:hypothetical protein